MHAEICDNANRNDHFMPLEFTHNPLNGCKDRPKLNCSITGKDVGKADQLLTANLSTK